LYERGAFVHVDVRPRIPPQHLARWNGERIVSRIA
jgi:hypothetical protein